MLVKASHIIECSLLAEIIPVAEPHCINLQGLKPLKLLFAMEGRRTEVMSPTCGVQQRYTLGPQCYSARLLTIPWEILARSLT